MAGLTWDIWSAFIVAGLIVLASIVYILATKKDNDNIIVEGEEEDSENENKEGS
ncbi:MAG: hypothetical protein ACTSU2_07705 [Promethearchaeota archaeon]